MNKGKLTLESLKKESEEGRIDTVLVCIVDMQGRLMGKRFHVENFLSHAHEETHGCNYLLLTDLEMAPVPGFKAGGWGQGYGDFIMKPDLSTMRTVPWLAATALVLCDVLDSASGEPTEHSPRAILKKQLARCAKLGITPMMATELEFFLFKDSYEEAANKHYQRLDLVSSYNEDYHILQTTKEEGVMRAIRNGLYGAGIPVECSKGEASSGQEEINIRYADALTTADNHAIVKNGCKEIAWSHGQALTFMAKWSDVEAGNSSHIHQSLWGDGGRTSLFSDKNEPHGMSELMRQYLAGLVAHASEFAYFLAPYTNSYKRFQEGTFAPTRAVWSMDNRTAGFRVCGEGSKAVRIECRIGGGDLNPHLAFAALLAAGLSGIENKMQLEDEFVGNAYAGSESKEIPQTLRAALGTLDKSSMLREAMGDRVVDHYLRAGLWEQSESDQRVNDWDLKRGFERA